MNDAPPHLEHEWASLTEREQAEVRSWFQATFLPPNRLISLVMCPNGCARDYRDCTCPDVTTLTPVEEVPWREASQHLYVEHRFRRRGCQCSECVLTDTTPRPRSAP